MRPDESGRPSRLKPALQDPSREPDPALVSRINPMADPLTSDPDDFRSVLASVDRDGRRRWLHVHLIGGLWRRRRAVLAVLLIAFYLSLPFLTVGGHPFFRLDLPQRTFWIAGQAFMPQDLWYFLILLLILGFTTLLAVATLGRVLCGWMCPHNVFLEMVYRPIERLCQGPAGRRAARKERRDPARIPGLIATWLLYALVGGILANTMTAIFVGTDGWRWGFLIDPVAHPAGAVFFAVVFALIWFDFAWFREQTCTIVCPYGRIQAVLLDPHSQVVAYDARRGEPRGHVQARVADTADAAAAAPESAAKGDCIDCKLCVAVCPTGIDIRNGNQLECIHCTACIDACDGVMTRLGRPKGLVRYASEAELSGLKRRLIRPRTIAYAAILLILCTVAVVRIGGRQELNAVLLRSTIPPAAISDDQGRAWVRNVIQLSLINHASLPQRAHLTIPAIPDARIVSRHQEVDLPAHERHAEPVVIDLPADRFAGQDLEVVLVCTAGANRTETRLRLRKP